MDFNLDKAKGAVHQIVTRLETRFTNFNISEIIKSGSMGHGTVVPDHYDIDLVLYSRDIRADDVIRQNGFHYWTAQLKEFIEREFGISSTIPGYNHRSVQFACQYEGVRLEVDLLVSPYWDPPSDFYQFLRRVPRPHHHIFTVCASKWQVKFFDGVENEAKEYIRRAKAWRNRVWSIDKIGRPSSYLISLLVVKAYETAGQFAGPEGVKRMLVYLVKSHDKDIYWERFYSLREYSDLLPARPRIVDPANPANNVWESGFMTGDSSVLIRKIDTIDLSRL
jgi:hypothetical protein